MYYFQVGGLKRWSDASTHPDQNDLDNAYNYFKNFIERF